MDIKNNMIIKLRTMKKELGKIDIQIDYLLNDLNKLTVSGETDSSGYVKGGNE